MAEVEIGIIADWLAEFSQSDRDAFASDAGCNSPSDETWAAVVAGARSRTVVSRYGVGR